MKKILLLLVIIAFVDCIKAQCIFTKIDSEDRTMAAIKSDGTLWIWGLNYYGNLGLGNTTNTNTPLQVGANTDWATISVSNSIMTALKNNGTLWAWGSNIIGSLGNGTNNDSYVPVQVGTDNNWLKISSYGYHSLALKTDGTLWAWGSNSFGALGDGTGVNKNTPIKIGNDNDWAKIYTGQYHSFAIKNNGTLWAWGHNIDGQLGDGTTINRLIPTQIGVATDWKMMALGTHTLGIKNDGTMWGTGNNAVGAIGNGTTVSQLSFTQIGSINNWVSVSAGDYYSTGLTADARMYTWGYNDAGQLGNGTTVNKYIPTEIGTSNYFGVFSSLIAGYQATIGLKIGGTISTVGDNTYGQLGNGTNISTLNFVDVQTPIQLSTSNQSVTLPQNTITDYATNCNNLIATVKQVQFPAMYGDVEARVWVEGTVTALTLRYVKRHFQIFPDNALSDRTGRVTLYVTQAEFNNFNGNNIVDLPANPTDAAGIANLRIEKRNGTTLNTSGLPNTYLGAASNIDPADASIIWNSTYNRWEITFDVTTGFGGFFITTSAFLLPVTLTQFTATNQGNYNVLNWQTATESNSNGFKIQRSADGTNFTDIGFVLAAGNSTVTKDYTFKDEKPLTGRNYYRLKQIDNDGKFAYSNIAIVLSNSKLDISLLQNPAIGTLQILTNSTLKQIDLLNPQGQLIKKWQANNSNKYDLLGVANGTYYAKVYTDRDIKILSVVVQ